jgi:glycosyltransferase involved in cell wall biosynthesis
MAADQARAHGHEWVFEYRATVPDDLATYDVVIAQLQNSLMFADMWEKLRSARRRPVIIYEMDDDFFEPVSGELVPADFMPQMRQNIKEILSYTDAVTTTTPELAASLRRTMSFHGLDTPVHVLPNCIPAWMLTHPRPRNRVQTLGWEGGIGHREDWIGPNLAVSHFLRVNKAWQFHVMGAPPPTCPRPGKHSRWYDNIEDYYRAIDFDLAVAPLADSQFNRGKSPIRLVEMYALGIPVIASNTGPYAVFGRENHFGIYANSIPEWKRLLHRWANDTTMRRNFRQPARDIASQYVIENRWEEWIDVYNRYR